MNRFQLVRVVLSFIATFYFFSGTAMADEHFISYTDNGQGKPLVLIHAFPTDKQLWEPQIEQLKQHFRVITLDLWGFGQSSPIELRAAEMSNYADEVKALLDQLHIDKAIIGGESMGGYVALAFLKKYPDNTSGLILSDTQSIADSDEVKEQREVNAEETIEHGTGHVIQSFTPKALSPNASEQTQNTLAAILSTQMPQPIAYSLRGMALREDTSDVLSNTNLPVLILTGDEDMIISPIQSKNMHTLAKNSQFVIIKNAGHLSNLEQPEQWNQAVIKMFA